MCHHHKKNINKIKNKKTLSKYSMFVYNIMDWSMLCVYCGRTCARSVKDKGAVRNKQEEQTC